MTIWGIFNAKTLPNTGTSIDIYIYPFILMRKIIPIPKLTSYQKRFVTDEMTIYELNRTPERVKNGRKSRTMRDSWLSNLLEILSTIIVLNKMKDRCFWNAYLGAKRETWNLLMIHTCDTCQVICWTNKENYEYILMTMIMRKSVY